MQGIFHSPDQKLYYTTEKLGMNGSDKDYSYRLSVVLPDRTLVSETKMVGSNRFDVQSLGMYFSKEYFGVWRPFLFHPAPNASIYYVTIAFTYLEQRSRESFHIT